MSINVGPTQGGKYICELNNATVENHGSSVLQRKKDYIYLGIEVKWLIVERHIIYRAVPL